MNELTALFKALSDRNRLRVVSALMQVDELCACQITELVSVTGATASRHMGVLIASGLVESRKDGRWVHYRLCREKVDLRILLDWLATQLDTVSDTADAKALADITSCEPEELCRRQRGDACCPQ